MTHLTRAQQAHDHEIRIEHTVDIASEAGIIDSSFRISDVMEDEMLDEMATANHHPSIEPLYAYLTKFGDSRHAVADQLSHLPRERPELLGLCLRVETPVRKRVDEHSVARSWGHTIGTWVFGLTYEEAWAQAVEWVENLEPRKYS